MSFKAMAWATEQTITQTSPQSHLLLIMASFANDMGECYPSINTMIKKTRLSEKTVRKCLKELLELELIADTKKSSYFGVKIYQLNLDTPSKSTTPSKNTGGSKSTSTPLVDLPQGGSKSTTTPLVNLPPNPIIEPINKPIIEPLSYDTHTHETQTDENSQNSSQTKPTAKNTKSDNSKSKKSKDYLTIDDLMHLKLSDFNFTDKDFDDYPNLGDWIFENMDYQIVKDYLAMRTNKLTMTAIKSSVKQASIAGLNLSQALEVCITSGKQGWQTFKAEWYFNSMNNQSRQPQPTSRMDELRHMASTSPTNVFVDDLPSDFQNYIGVNS